MKDYKYKFMTDAMKDEMEELLKGEHGETLYAWSRECAEVAIKGFKHGIRDGAIKGLILGCAVVGAADIIESIYKYRKMRKAEKKAAKKAVVDATVADSVEETE